MIRVKKKKKIKRKKIGNVKTTERTTKKGGNVSQVVNVYVTKGGGGRRKAPAQRPTFFQSQPQLFTANYDNTLLNQIQPIQDKYIKMFNTNNDLLNKLLTKQRTSDSSIQTDTLTHDKLFTKETQTAPEKIPVFRPADTQTEPIKFNTTSTQSDSPLTQPIATQTEPIRFNTIGTQSDAPLTRARRIQTEPTLTRARRIQTEPIQSNVIETQTKNPNFTTTGTQSDTPIFQSINTQTAPQPLTETRQITSDMDLQEYLNYLTNVGSDEESDIDEKLGETLQTQITILSNELEDAENRVLELGGNKKQDKLIFITDQSKKLKAIKKKIKSYEKQEQRLLLEQKQDRRDDDPVEELNELIKEDEDERRGAEEDPLISQLVDIRNRAIANKIELKRGKRPTSEEGIKKQIKYYSEAIAIKNRASSI